MQLKSPIHHSATNYGIPELYSHVVVLFDEGEG